MTNAPVMWYGSVNGSDLLLMPVTDVILPTFYCMTIIMPVMTIRVTTSGMNLVQYCSINDQYY